MDYFDLHVLRPVSALVWLVIAVLICRLHRHLSSLLMLGTNLIVFALDITLQLAQRNLLILADTEYRAAYLTWGVVGLINGPLLYWYVISLIRAHTSTSPSTTTPA